MNAMAQMAQAEMERARRVWGAGGGSSHQRKTRAVKSKVDAAIKQAAEIHQVSSYQILKRTQLPAIVEARQAAMLFARQAGLSFPDIGRHMKRHHTTVMHGVKAAQARLKPEPIFKTTRTKEEIE